MQAFFLHDKGEHGSWSIGYVLQKYGIPFLLSVLENEADDETPKKWDVSTLDC
jgi:hypothetical protein